MKNSYPKIKNTIIPYRDILNDCTLLRVNGELAEISDTDGLIFDLINYMDGRKTIDEIVDFFSDRKNSNELRSIIQDFINFNFVEDNIHTSILDSYTNERWSRNIDFFGSICDYEKNKYEYQNKIKNAKLVLIGCGGLGSHILLELVSVGFQNIKLVDFDKIELANLNRQILYKEDDIGSLKVFKAKERILEYNTQANIEAIHKRIDSKEDIDEIIDSYDLVICVADKPRNKLIDWLNKSCISKKIPFINGGLDIRRAVFYSVIPGKTGCVECWKGKIKEDNSQLDWLLNEEVENNIDYFGPGPAFSPLVAVASGVMVLEAVNYITNIKPLELTNKLKAFYFDTLSISEAEHWSLNEFCTVCGKNSTF